MKQLILPAIAAIAIVLTIAGCKKKNNFENAFYPSHNEDFYGTVWSGTANGSETDGDVTTNYTQTLRIEFFKGDTFTIDLNNETRVKTVPIQFTGTFWFEKDDKKMHFYVTSISPEVFNYPVDFTGMYSYFTHTLSFGNTCDMFGPIDLTLQN